MGMCLGLAAFILAGVAFLNLSEIAGHQRNELPRDVSFLAPVQQAGSALTVEVSNFADKFSMPDFIGYAWPALFALVVWVYGTVTNKQWFKNVGWILGWTLLAWAALRAPNGAEGFLAIIAAFLLFHVAIPACRQLWRMPANSAGHRKAAPHPPSPRGWWPAWSG